MKAITNNGNNTMYLDITDTEDGGSGTGAIQGVHDRENEAARFLNLLYGDNTADGHLVIFTKADKASRFYKLDQLGQAVHDAASMSETQDVYYGVGLQKERSGNGRGKETTIGSIPGLWLDLDIKGANHASENLPPDTESAKALLKSYPLKPTLIVSTGGGFHVYWLFKTPLRIRDDSDISTIKALSKRFQNVFMRAAAEKGWKIDDTSDLARVLRLPGTFNHKQSEPFSVELIEYNEDHRYDVDEIETTLESTEKPDTGHQGATSDPIPEGTRNTTITSIGGSLRAGGMEYETILQRLTLINQARCKPPLPDTEIITISQSVSGYEPNNNGTRREPTHAQRIIALFEGVELFHTSDGESFAEINVNNHREVWPLRSKQIRDHISRQFYGLYDTAPSSQGLQDAMGVLEGKAQYGSPRKEVFIRLAYRDDCVFLDLCNEDWEVVKITSDGWEVIKDCPVRFRRSASMKSLPKPISGGKISQIKDFINVGSRSEWVLIISWLIGALNPNGPYPILILQGEQGSAKSTTAKILRALIDPSSAPIRALSRSERDLMISANNGWVLAFDNLSGIPPWISDAFCRISTGGGFSVRKHYTDADEMVFEAMRPVILNGIDQVSGRHDLLDRSLVVNLPRIPEENRKLEKELWASFALSQPAILGALLSAVSEALKNFPSVNLDSYPRMADYAKWVIAAEPKLFGSKQVFMKYYNENRDESAETSLESDTVASVLRSYLEEKKSVQMSAKDLKHELELHIKGKEEEDLSHNRYWPKSPRALADKLRRISDALRKTGINIDHKRSGGSRLWEIELQGDDSKSRLKSWK